MNRYQVVFLIAVLAAVVINSVFWGILAEQFETFWFMIPSMVGGGIIGWKAGNFWIDTDWEEIANERSSEQD